MMDQIAMPARRGFKLTNAERTALQDLVWDFKHRPPHIFLAPGMLVWTTGTPLGAPWVFGQALTIDQTIWLLDGYQIQKFSESTGQWTTEPAPFTYCEQRFCLAANNRIYVISGFEACWSCTSYVEEYDPSTGALVARSPIPVACIKAGVAATPDGKIYVCGGCIPVPDGSSGPAYLDILQVYDTQTDTWTVKKSMPTQRAIMGAVAGSDGKIYVAGGMIKDGKVTDVLEVYQPSTDSWSVKSLMHHKKAHFGTVLIGGNAIYCIGGFTGEMKPDVWSSVDVYDCIHDIWSSATPLSQGRWGLAAAVLGSNRIYAMGGVLPDWANGTADDMWFDLVEVGTIT
jgi:hypothetical protein